MKFSLIDERAITENKGGYLSSVHYVATCDTLQEFADTLLHNHVAPAVFRDGLKKQANFESIGFVCFDFDCGHNMSSDIHKQLCREKINHVILGSKNHLKDKGDGRGIIERFHLFIPLERPIDSIPLYKEMAKAMPMIYQWDVDKNCSDVSRYFYRHSRVLFVEESFTPLALARYELRMEYNAQIAEHSKREHELKKSVNPIEPNKCFEATTYFKMLSSGALNGDGNRYSLSSSIIGGMIKCGMDLSRALSYFDRFTNYGESFTRDSIVRRFNQWS